VGDDAGVAAHLHAGGWDVRPVAGASPEEGAAIVAALERFFRDTAPPAGLGAKRSESRWLRAARLEAVRGESRAPNGWRGTAWH
jgi:hypothetical protein